MVTICSCKINKALIKTFLDYLLTLDVSIFGNDVLLWNASCGVCHLSYQFSSHFSLQVFDLHEICLLT